MSGSGCDGSSGSGSSGCSRVLTKEQMIKGLKAGKLLYVDRRDAPELPELLALEAEGLVKKRLVFWWIGSVA